MPRRYYSYNPTPQARDGFSVTFDAQEESVTVQGWYDGGQTIEPQTLPLWQFIAELGINALHLDRALDELDKRTRVSAVS